METSTQEALRGALLRLLRPLVRLMLRHGMAYGSFAELARKAFVDEGQAELRRAGKRASISAVAALTGLTRKEAARLADAGFTVAQASDQRYNRAVRVVTAWSRDERFTDRGGRPRTLPVDGDNSFATLVGDYSGDVTPAAMLAILETGGTVRREAGAVELLDRAYLPTQTPAASLAILGSDVAELIATIEHNLSGGRETRFFQRKVSNVLVRADAVPAFRRMSNEKSQALLEEYNGWLGEHQVDAAAGEAGGRYIAVGIYYFDDTLPRESEA